MSGEAISAAGYQRVDSQAAAKANRDWWSAEADSYLAEHGEFLGDADFCWCPEGLRESEAGLLGPVDDLRSQRVLEVGAGAAQCSRWLRQRGVDVVATDVAPGMIGAAAELDQRTGIHVPALVADARHLPFADDSFGVAFTAFGAIPFVADAHRVHTEVARVLRPGGRWVFSVTHPMRWSFPDDPTSHGLGVVRSYFDRTPYAELDGRGNVIYSEFHRTIGDHIRDIISAGLRVVDLIEPEWPEHNTNIWGGWGPERGAYLPGTAIFSTIKP
ncbi:MAG TPA: class I SAM-dependent methyltransferase [Beutenbergiaceae bacterium]|nr:class I SAM-dependent methyltransferase [Beutenbergiaceae bacterium]